MLEQIDSQNAYRFWPRHSEIAVVGVVVAISRDHPVRHAGMTLKPHPSAAATVARALQPRNRARVRAPAHIMHARRHARSHAAPADVPHLRLEEVERRENREDCLEGAHGDGEPLVERLVVHAMRRLGLPSKLDEPVLEDEFGGGAGAASEAQADTDLHGAAQEVPGDVVEHAGVAVVELLGAQPKARVRVPHVARQAAARGHDHLEALAQKRRHELRLGVRLGARGGRGHGGRGHLPRCGPARRGGWVGGWALPGRGKQKRRKKRPVAEGRAWSLERERERARAPTGRD